MSEARDYEATSEPETSGRAIAALVCGVLAIGGVLPCLGSVLAIWLGVPEDSPVGRAGLLLGCLSLAIPLLILVLTGCFAVPVLFLTALF